MKYLQTCILIALMIFATSSFAAAEQNQHRLASDHVAKEVEAMQGGKTPTAGPSSTKAVKAEDEECE